MFNLVLYYLVFVGSWTGARMLGGTSTALTVRIHLHLGTSLALLMI